MKYKNTVTQRKQSELIYCILHINISLKDSILIKITGKQITSTRFANAFHFVNT